MGAPLSYFSGVCILLWLAQYIYAVPVEYDSTWLKLGHYHKNWGEYKSTIDHGSFFIHPEGRTNPAWEFEATRKSIATGVPKIGTHRMDPICAFPARAKYMQHIFGGKLRDVECSEFQIWKENINLSSISVIFSSEYISNPASMFGHTFLKMNLKNTLSMGSDENSLLDYGVSFAAISNPNDGLLYIVKGLLGGYQGVFRIHPFYELVNEYEFSENRDLWEYRIKITRDQAALFLEHLWELYANASVDYYFMDDNCSYLLLELLEVIFPHKELTKEISLFVTPVETIRVIQERLPSEGVIYRPSQRQKFFQEYDKLNPFLQSRIQTTTKGDDDLSHLTIDEKITVIDKSLQFLKLRKSKLALNEQTELRQIETQLLLRRLKIDKTSQQIVMHKPSSFHPGSGHRNRKFELSGITNKAVNSSKVRLRYGYHDLMDPAQGQETYSQINYLDLHLLMAREMTYQLAIAEVFSLAPYRVLEPQYAWMLGGGFQGGLSPHQKHDIYIEGGLGLASMIAHNQFLSYIMPKIKLLRSEIEGNWQGMLASGIIWKPIASYRFKGELIQNLKKRKKISFQFDSFYDLSVSYQIFFKTKLAYNDRELQLGLASYY